MNFMNKIEKQFDNAAQFGMEHPLKECVLADKETYIKALAVTIAAGESLRMNEKFINSVIGELGVKVDFIGLVAEYQTAPEHINLNEIICYLKNSDNFHLLILDAAMVAPEIYSKNQIDVWDFLQELHSRFNLEEKNGERYPAMFQFATALAKADKTPDFLDGTTSDFFIRNTWAHILKFKQMYSGDAMYLPDLCQSMAPGKVWSMFQCNNFTTDEDGNLLLGTAIFYNNIRTVKFLLSKGIDVNAIGTDGETAINEYWLLLNVEMLDLLLKHNATISEQSIVGILARPKPEMIICLMRHRAELLLANITSFIVSIENVRTFLENGGDPNLTCGDQLWIDSAIMMENQELVELLKEFGAEPSPDAKSWGETSEELQKMLDQIPREDLEEIWNSLNE